MNRAKRLVGSALRALVTKVSRRYIAGPALEDALRVARTLTDRGYSVTLGYWDAPDDPPDAVLDTNVAALGELARLGAGSYLSIKLPALGSDPARFAALRRMGRSRGAPLHFDALGSDGADPTFRLIEQLEDRHAGEIGCTLPGRWQRSVADAQRAVALGLDVRVVKGQFADAEDPGRDPQRGYLEVIRALAGRARSVRVATHDPAVAREALTLLREGGTPCSLELLYGLPVGRQVALARAFGVPVRVYIAYGKAYLPYALGSMRRDPRALWSLLREAARGSALAGFPAAALPAVTLTPPGPE